MITPEKDTFEPADTPRPAQHVEATLGRRRRASVGDVHAMRDQVIDLQPREGQGLRVADDQVELDPFPPCHPVRGQVPFVSERPKPVPRPDRLDKDHEPCQHAGEDQPACAGQGSRRDEEQREGGADAHVVLVPELADCTVHVGAHRVHVRHGEGAQPAQPH
jgi:hypothetical protein